MPSLFARLRAVFADRRAAPRLGGRYTVELIVGITAGQSPATLFTHTLDVSRGGLSVFLPRVEAAPFLSGGAAPLTITLTLPQGSVSMLAAPKHVHSLKEAPPLERGYAVGFQIVEMSAADYRVYRSFIDGLTGG